MFTTYVEKCVKACNTTNPNLFKILQTIIEELNQMSLNESAKLPQKDALHHLRTSHIGPISINITEKLNSKLQSKQKASLAREWGTAEEDEREALLEKIYIPLCSKL
jgi:hypothetical protein